jgi:hypothetical protein
VKAIGSEKPEKRREIFFKGVLFASSFLFIEEHLGRFAKREYLTYREVQAQGGNLVVNTQENVPCSTQGKLPHSGIC